VETAPRTGRPPSAIDEASVRQVEEIKRSYQNQEAGQDQQRYPPPAGQCSGPQIGQCLTELFKK